MPLFQFFRDTCFRLRYRLRRCAALSLARRLVERDQPRPIECGNDVVEGVGIVGARLAGDASFRDLRMPGTGEAPRISFSRF